VGAAGGVGNNRRLPPAGAQVVKSAFATMELDCTAYLRRLHHSSTCGGRHHPSAAWLGRIRAPQIQRGGHIGVRCIVVAGQPAGQDTVLETHHLAGRRDRASSEQIEFR